MKSKLKNTLLFLLIAALLIVGLPRLMALYQPTTTYTVAPLYAAEPPQIAPVPTLPTPAVPQAAPPTDAQLAAIEAQLRMMQDQIAATAAALDACQNAGRVVVLPCDKIEARLVQLMAQQRALLVAAAQASGQ